MNKIINFLIKMCNTSKMYLFHIQEKNLHKKVIKICEEISKLYNIKMDVYSEINYFEGRDAIIYFIINDETDEEILTNYLYEHYIRLFEHYNFTFIVSYYSMCNKNNIIWTNNYIK